MVHPNSGSRMGTFRYSRAMGFRMPVTSQWDMFIGARRGRRHLALLTGLALRLAACGPAGVHPWTPPTDHDTKDDPGAVRPGYGNAELHTWYPLTAPEVAAL